MARGKQKVAVTTITEAKAARFLQDAEIRQSLFCKNLPGFHLLKLPTGGAWRYRYTNAEGKRKLATVEKYSILKPDAAAEIVHGWILAGTDPLLDRKESDQTALNALQQAANRTLRNYLDNQYKPHMERSWKPKNATANYQRIAVNFAVLLDRDMSSLDSSDLNTWQRKAEKAGLAYSTVKRAYSSLKTMLNHALTAHAIESDPLANHKLLEPTIKDQQAIQNDESKADRRMLTTAEIQGIQKGLDLFAEAKREERRNSRAHGKPHLPDLDKKNYPHWFIPFCLLDLHTGLRPGDLFSLEWPELNIQFGRLTKMTGKSAHAIRRERKPAIVDMRLNPAILAVMKKWNADQGKPKTGLVFPSTKTGRQFDEQAHQKPWKQVKALGGIDEGLDFYAFRHHFISSMLAAGVPIFTVAKLAGLKSIQMIQDNYGHLCPDQATKALDIVARTIDTTYRIKGKKA